MKIILVLVGVFVLAAAAIYFSGALSSPDPKALADEIRNKVKAGMTWEDVAKVREPRNFVCYDSKSATGARLPIKYDANAIRATIAQNGFEDGFYYEYKFSEAIAVKVNFNPKGICENWENMVTSKDILEGKLFQRSNEPQSGGYTQPSEQADEQAQTQPAASPPAAGGPAAATTTARPAVSATHPVADDEILSDEELTPRRSR